MSKKQRYKNIQAEKSRMFLLNDGGPGKYKTCILVRYEKLERKWSASFLFWSYKKGGPKRRDKENCKEVFDKDRGKAIQSLRPLLKAAIDPEFRRAHDLITGKRKRWEW
jgi:hypothetical protein